MNIKEYSSRRSRVDGHPFDGEAFPMVFLIGIHSAGQVSSRFLVEIHSAREHCPDSPMQIVSTHTAEYQGISRNIMHYEGKLSDGAPELIGLHPTGKYFHDFLL